MQASRYLKYFQSPLEEGKAKKKVPFWKLTEKERVEKYRKMKDLKKPKIRVLSGKQWQEQILIAVTKYDQMMQNEAEEMTEKPEWELYDYTHFVHSNAFLYFDSGKYQT